MLFELTEELKAAIDAAKPAGETRNAFLERCLWAVPVIKKAAAKAGIEKPVRRQPGRPKSRTAETAKPKRKTNRKA